jgi:hypothetical protein
MQVKITKTGKYRLMMSYALRLAVWELLINFLESETNKLLFVKIDDDLNRHLYAAVLHETMMHTSFHLYANWETRILLKKSQALALIWLMRNVEGVELINLKGELHKLLS